MADDNNLSTGDSVPDDDISEPANRNRPRKWFYLAVTVVTISIAVYILVFIATETVQQADRQIETGVEKHWQLTENSKFFKKVLDDMKSGKDVTSCIAELGSINEKINAKRMIIGFKTYSVLKKYVTGEDMIHYEDLREKIQPFLDEVRSHNDISVDTLFFAYMARDIILYLFVHKEIFLIHDDDNFVMGKDGRSLEAFYKDALIVYDFLKQIIRYQINDPKGFWKDADNGNLFIVAMYCKARWATAGLDDSQAVQAVFHSLESNKFPLDGPAGEWLKWLKGDLGAVKNGIRRMKLKRNRPGFVSTTWLK
ncbi:MAG: hypothetical protein BA867_14475 [Desulfobacterales bacterium S5133MH16]|nr:MAG: hypothetical protein BA867_14475 [Desulfobacterales bacterium S5133MH16]